MGWTPYQGFLAGMMVVTGSINTLSTKWADRLNSTNSEGKEVPFKHPFLQASGMFLGEFTCFIAFLIQHFYHRRRQREIGDLIPMNTRLINFNPLIFLVPALCDMTATSTMYIGLTLTFAASFQMFRGAVIIFTGLLSVAFLGRILKSREWIGIFSVILGLVIVGLTDTFFSKEVTGRRNDIITGDLLILTAQVITAIQMVYEEKFISKYNVPPLLAVGLEGFFGFVVLGVLLVPMYHIKVGPPFSGNPRGTLEDALDGLTQLGNNTFLLLAFCGTIVSIAFFNFAGVSVTKEISATTRTVLDSVRTLVIWVVSLALSWQGFFWPQVLGFLVLVFGMCLYNNVIVVPLLRKWGCMKPDEPDTEHLIAQRSTLYSDSGPE
ncbi:unnamed protein product [Darwinula stevensoni]|uniref:Solute carrier family 35 member F6 n=1 Tax=Darwinula stevensoni TaxID=69355 RepID=A0A7R9A2G9_9CRUS|nr:unnamed protein product [Darwinula stevensoni]CAG0885631.1 unnamed protein product [Darwinula stevensoni]